MTNTQTTAFIWQPRHVLESSASQIGRETIAAKLNSADALAAENAKLADGILHRDATIKLAVSELDDLRTKYLAASTENAKLREALAECIKYGTPLAQSLAPEATFAAYQQARAALEVTK